MCNIFHKYIFWTSTTNTLQHLILMLPPSCCHAAAAQQCRRHPCRCAATIATMLPRSCRHTATTATLPLLLRCPPCPHVATKLLPPPLPPCCCHCRCHCQAVAATPKLLSLPLSTLSDRFDDEKWLCKLTDDDFCWLYWLFWLGIKFLHGWMFSIFNALVYLSLTCICLQSYQ